MLTSADQPDLWNLIRGAPSIDPEAQHQLLDGLVARYGLRLTHFQSHYLPKGGRLASNHWADSGS